MPTKQDKMTKSKSNSAVASPEKRNGDSGRIKKSSSTMEKTKAKAKEIVRAARDGDIAKPKSVLKKKEVSLQKTSVNLFQGKSTKAEKPKKKDDSSDDDMDLDSSEEESSSDEDQDSSEV
jgi:hypothetical protein